MELQGSFTDFCLPDIIQLMQFARKTGVLRIVSEDGGAALYFEQGRVVHAECHGSEGEEAVFSLFQMPEAEFRFDTEPLPESRTITKDPANLVMEAAWLLDESLRDKNPNGTGSTWSVASSLFA